MSTFKDLSISIITSLGFTNYQPILDKVLTDGLTVNELMDHSVCDYTNSIIKIFTLNIIGAVESYSELHSTTGKEILGVLDMSKSTIIALATRGGYVGVNESGKPNGYIPELWGYRFRWISTKGKNNVGRLIMTATTDTNQVILDEGAIVRLVKVLKIEYQLASDLVLKGSLIPRGKEMSVLKTLVRNIDNPGWSDFPLNNYEINDWLIKYGIKTRLSNVRIVTVNKVRIAIGLNK